jgi:hypothetical protein
LLYDRMATLFKGHMDVAFRCFGPLFFFAPSSLLFFRRRLLYIQIN